MGIISSCSTTSLSDFFSGEKSSNSRNQELLDDFDVEEKVLEQFKEKPQNVEKPKTKKIEKDLPQKKSKKDKKKAITKRRVIKPTPTNIKAPIVRKKGFQYPDDYPQKLRNLDRISQKFWSKFTPYFFEGEKMVMDISYLGLSTGKITISSEGIKKIGTRDSYHINARIKTSAYYSYLYSLDDYCDSYLSIEENVPLKFSLIQRESKQDIDDLQLFDIDKLKTYTFYKRVTSEKTKKSKNEKFIPRFYQDPLSVLYFLRGLPLHKGTSFTIPIVNKGKVEVMNVKSLGTEKIKTEIGKKDAIKLAVTTKHKGDTIEGGSMTFWFSNDSKRIFLKFNAKIKIGSVSGHILEYTEN